MKRIVLVLMAIAIVSSAALAGDMAKSGQWGIQTSLGAATGVSGTSFNSSTVGLKFMASENLAIRVEAGVARISRGGGGSSSSAYDFGAGFEYHMTAVGNVSPYVGLGAGYSGVSLAGAQNNPSQFGVLGYW